jgi:hypothetical protein
MGETLGIAHNVFEKMEREKDRKERLKKYEEWQKEQEKRKLRLKDMQARKVGPGAGANVMILEIVSPKKSPKDLALYYYKHC